MMKCNVKLDEDDKFQIFFNKERLRTNYRRKRRSRYVVVLAGVHFVLMVVIQVMVNHDSHSNARNQGKE